MQTKHFEHFEYVRTDNGSDKQISKWLRFATWIVRLVVGGVFVFSGLAKCIDPWGTMYKMQDYVAAVGLTLSDGIYITGAFLLSMIEFMTGIFLIFGCFRRFTPWLLSLIMLFMLPLTLWIAIKNPVADCGCFGDALLISNWQTFWKNVVLSAGAVWLVFFNRRTGWLIRPYLQWLAVVATGIFTGCVSLIGYSYQPLIDFRPYKVGTEIYSQAASDDEPELIFIYEKDGVNKEFTEDNLPDEADGWTFVDRKEVEKKAVTASEDREKDIVIWDETEDEEVTSEVLGMGGKQLLMLIPELDNNTILSDSYTINSMHTWANQHDIDFTAIVGATTEQIAQWRDLALPEYPIYRADDTTIKEIARGNPAMVYLEDGVIKWKRTLRSLQVQDFMDDDSPKDCTVFEHDDRQMLINITSIYVAVMAVLILISFMQAIYKALNLTRKPAENQNPEARQ